MATIINYRILLRGGPQTEWLSKDPVLLAREPALDTTTWGMKVGDGLSRWSQLDYVWGGEDYNLTIGTVAPGESAAASIVGTAPNQQLNLTLPRGLTGATGPTGNTGPAGPPANISLAPVTTLAPGSAATATITGTAPNYTLAFSIPRGNTGATGQQGAQGPTGLTGDTGPTGATGPSNVLTIGTVAGGTTAAATITGTSPSQVLNLTLPKGDKGDTGNTGPANTLSVGAVTTGAPGSAASVTISGTAPNQTLAFTIPQGATGTAAAITGATATASAPGSAAAVTLGGTDTARTFAFTLPRGDTGPQGPIGPEGPKGATGAGLQVNGTVATAADLPTTGMTNGMAYIANDTGLLHVWGDSGWSEGLVFTGPKGDTGPAAATTIPTKPASDLPNTYPEGISILPVADPALGWPAGYGVVENVRFGVNRSYQTFVERTTARSWRRTPDAQDAGWLAWVEWGAKGATGDVGPANVLSVGTVSTLAPGAAATASITGTSPSQSISFGIPQGAVGATGDTGAPGPSNVLSIGTVTTGAAGAAAAATITGTSPSQTLDLTIPQGVKGDTGATGPGVPIGGTAGQVLRKTTATDLDTSWVTLDYAPSSHTHLWAHITDKPTTFAPSAHTHAAADINSGTLAAARIPLATASAQGGISAANFSRLNGAISTATASTLALRDAAGRAQFADPSSLSDAATKNYVDTGLGTKAATSHTHLWAHITDKPATFAPSAHTHLWADLTDKPASFTPSAHTHATADVTGLDTALSGKASLGAAQTFTAAQTFNAGGTTPAIDTTHITVRPRATGGSASMFLDNANGRVWEFFANNGGSFGVYNVTSSIQPLTIAADAPASALTLGTSLSLGVPLAMGGRTISGVAAPTADDHAANQGWVNTGLAGKASSTHNHDAAAINSGTLAAARIPLATSAAQGGINATLFTRLNGAVSTGTASTLVLRDAAGRAQFADPSATADAATKNYVDNGLSGKAASTHTHAQSEVTNLTSDLAAKAPAAAALPTGGAAGQFLVKSSATDYAAGWVTKEWVGSQASYDAIATKDGNVTYYITS